MSSPSLNAAQTVRRLEDLAGITDEPGVITRTFLSPAMARANQLVGEWMRAAGGDVEIDSWGNLIGHWAGGEASQRTLLLGSHLDTVPNGGKYDGAMGVLVALAALERLAAEQIQLPFAVDILGFSDEEGVRFHSAYLGSKALIGQVDPALRQARDARGISVEEAVALFQNAPVAKAPEARYRSEDLLGYVEVHLEQGPVLQERGLAAGVVTEIAAQTRLRYAVEGRAGHAGTTPMSMRQDALTGAAELILAVESIGAETGGLVATVGELQVESPASNVIPSRVKLSVDIRHPESREVESARAQLQRQVQEIGERRRLILTETVVQTTEGVACAPALVDRMAQAILRHQAEAPRLVSGAGHDGVVLSRMTPMVMLFVRCRDGLSHHPDEYVEEADIAVAIEVLADFLREMR